MPCKSSFEGERGGYRACFPVQTCWPEDVATAGDLAAGDYPRSGKANGINLGIYRHAGASSRNKLIMRWLAASRRRTRFPCTGKRELSRTSHSRFPWRSWRGPGDDSGHGYAGARLRFPNTHSPDCCAAPAKPRSCARSAMSLNGLPAPASAEIVLEGVISSRTTTAQEGPFGDHTGYYNEVERFSGFHHRTNHPSSANRRSTTVPIPGKSAG